MSFINTQGHLVSALLHFQERILSRVHIHSLWVLIILWDKLYTCEEEIVNLLNHFKSCLRKTYQVKWNKFEIQCFQNIYYSRRLFNGNFYENCFHPIKRRCVFPKDIWFYDENDWNLREILTEDKMTLFDSLKSTMNTSHTKTFCIVITNASQTHKPLKITIYKA